MSNQTGGAVRHSIAADFAAYEHLPPPLRAVVAAAPYRWSAVRTLQHWREADGAGIPLAVFRADMIEAICRRILTMAKRTYGATHPDATYHRRTRQPVRPGRRRSKGGAT